MLDGALPATSPVANPTQVRSRLWLPQLAYPSTNGRPRYTRRTGYRHLATTPDGQSFRRHDEPPRTLIYYRGKRLVTITYASFIYHPSSITQMG